MSKQLHSRAWLGLALMLAIACVSCGKKTGDSPFDPANLGSVAVVVSPSGLDAPWVLDGPSGLHRTGSGTTTVGSMAAGAYTITWGATGGWESPAPSMGDLATGGTLTLTGVFTPLEPGTINIDCGPAECPAPWRLEWNSGGSFRTGAGSASLTDQPAGEYVIKWQAVDGWYLPAPAQSIFTLAPASVQTVTGRWTQMPPGSVQIDPNPDSLNAPWTLLGPSGYQLTGTGDSVVSALPGGSYSVQWGAVNGWTSPSPALATGTLAANGLLAFHGTYVEVPPATISVDVVPNTITAQWTLTGPNGYSLTRAGDWTIPGLEAGLYTISWGTSGGSWTSPSPAVSSHSVAAGETHTFSGTYTAVPPATIIVDVTPNTIAAQWTLTGPNGYILTRSGDWTQSGLAAGQYVLTWSSAGVGWVTPVPASSSHTVTSGSTYTFSGTYLQTADLTMVSIAPGTFVMGSPATEVGRRSETQHTVTISKGFLISAYETTRAQYQLVTGQPPVQGTDANRPAEAISWIKAVEFCNALSALDGLEPVYDVDNLNFNAAWNRAANGYRLPTEAEWEYACRAGTVTAYNLGGSEAALVGAGWYTTNAGGQSHVVGGKASNAWGLFDMHGNVLEWVWDWYDDYSTAAQQDPIGPTSGGWRVIRGGNYMLDASWCRSAARYNAEPYNWASHQGFRVARNAP